MASTKLPYIIWPRSPRRSASLASVNLPCRPSPPRDLIISHHAHGIVVALRQRRARCTFLQCRSSHRLAGLPRCCSRRPSIRVPDRQRLCVAIDAPLRSDQGADGLQPTHQRREQHHGWPRHVPTRKSEGSLVLVSRNSTRRSMALAWANTSPWKLSWRNGRRRCHSVANSSRSQRQLLAELHWPVGV